MPLRRATALFRVIIGQVSKPLISLRRIVAFFSVVAVLLAALSPASPGLLWAIVVPLLLLAGAVATVSAQRQPDDDRAPTFFWQSVSGSRAPPLLDPLI